MKNRIKVRKYLLVFSFAFMASIGWSQLNPLLDPNLELIPSKSDEFDGATGEPDPSLWEEWDQSNTTSSSNPGPPDIYNTGPGGVGQVRFANTYIENDELVFRLDAPNSFGASNTGIMHSKNRDYLYGYLEIEAKLPGVCEDQTGALFPCGEKLGAGFWTYYRTDWPNIDPIHYHDEIDILEPAPPKYNNTDINTVGVHHEIDPSLNNGYNTYKALEGDITSSTSMSLNYHTYGLLWMPDRVVFYLDGQPMIDHSDDPSLVMNAEHWLVLGLHVHGGAYHPDMGFPQYMRTKYFRYYEFKSECNLDVTLSNQSIFNAFGFGIHERIKMGGGTSISVPTGLAYNSIYRAVKELTILPNFEVPLGVEFALIPTPCDQ